MSLFGGDRGNYKVPSNRAAHRPAGMSDAAWDKANRNFDHNMNAYRRANSLNPDNSSSSTMRRPGAPGGRSRR